MVDLLCDKATNGAFSSYASLTSLEIRGLHFPTFNHLARLISVFPHLENILLLDVTWNASSGTPDLAVFTSLRSLSISASSISPLLEWFSRHDLPALHSVGFALPDASTSSQIFAFTTKLPLTHVEIGPTKLPALGELAKRIVEHHSMVIHATVEMQDFRRSFYVLRRPLRGRGQSCRIAVQQLAERSVLCHITGPRNGSWEDDLDWQGLDEVFSSHRFTGFERIVLVLDSSHRPEHVWRHMPRSTSRGVLAFSRLRQLCG
ncbi:hypothetical protein DFH09DRAFT_587117 [Mycena vulgaris]|nr:hypothetical protein DFH09DRAFT_587117 [Mycena vulgaris]